MNNLNEVKTLKLLFVALFATLLLVSCEKDENGQRIKYYDKPTGEGYVFVKNEDGTITPFANKKDCLALEASGNAGSGLFSPFWKHTDIYSTDENGKYTCKFVRKIDKNEVQYYDIYFIGGFVDTHVFGNGQGEWGGYYCIPKDFSNNELIIIDTIFVTLRKM